MLEYRKYRGIQYADDQLRQLTNNYHYSNSVWSKSFWPFVLVFIWPLGCLLVRFTIMGGWLIDSTGIIADISKSSVHVLTAFILFEIARKRGVHGVVLRPLVYDPLMWFFIMTQCVSSIMGETPLISLGLVATLLLLFIAARLLLALVPRVDILRGLGVFSMIAFISLIAAILLFGISRGNSRGVLDNLIGDPAMLAGCLAFTWKKPWLRFPILAGAITSILIVESRAALLGLTVACIVMLFQSSWRSQVRFGLVLFILLGVILALPILETKVVEFGRTTLRLDDQARGLGSGFTGRVERWKFAWSLFEQRPLLGSGPRTQAHYEIADWSGAHNGYIATLVEVGILGTLSIFALLVRGFYWSFKHSNNLLARVLLAVAVAFFVRAVFENALFNGVTASTVIIILWLEYSRFISMRKA